MVRLGSDLDDYVSILVCFCSMEYIYIQFPPEPCLIWHVFPMRKPLCVELVNPALKGLLLCHCVDRFMNWSTALVR